jgi:hypothetical protein
MCDFRTRKVPVASSKEGKDASAPAAGLARLYLDGAGSVSGNAGLNLRGVWLQGTIGGTYEVSDDCTVTFSLTNAAGAAEHYSGVIAGHGDSVLILQTDAGSGVSGQIKKTRGFCQAADLAGAFAIQYSGSLLREVNSPFNSTGILSLDGEGAATAVESGCTGASSALAQASGTVTVLSDCSVTLSLVSPNGAMNFYGLISQDLKQLLIVQSDAGTNVKGIATLQ